MYGTFSVYHMLFLCSRPPPFCSSTSTFFYLTISELFIAVRFPVPSLCPVSYQPVPALLCCILHLHLSQPLLLWYRPVFHYAASVLWSCKYLVPCRKTSRYFCLSKTMVVPPDDKRNWSRLAIDTWSVGEVAVTAKLNETKLQAGQEKYWQSKPQSWGVASSAQSLRCVTSDGNTVLEGYTGTVGTLKLYIIFPVAAMHNLIESQTMYYSLSHNLKFISKEPKILEIL